MSTEQLTILAVAAACVAVVGLIGQLLIYLMRKHSLASLLTMMTCTSLCAVGLAVVVDARIMFLSRHDTVVIGLALATAIPLAIGLALSFALQIRKSTKILSHTARNLSRAETAAAPRGLPTRELSQLQHDLLAAGAEVRAARAHEQAIETSRRELISGISHDLRTPLAGIRAMAEALADGVATDPNSYHQQLKTEAERLSQLVDSLFLLSRLHASSLPFKPMELDLWDLSADTVNGLLPLAKSHGVHLALSRGESADPILATVDPQHLFRSLSNLLVNAIHNTPAPGQITVQLQSTDLTAQIAVTDTCGGIAPSDLPRLFDLAWRGASARHRGPTGGGGLGLSVAQGLIAAHSGRITVENYGPGCRFTIILPLVG